MESKALTIEPGTVAAMIAAGRVVIYKPRRREVWIDGYKRRKVEARHHGAMLKLCKAPPLLEP
jgi:hypothetical protein